MFNSLKSKTKKKEIEAPDDKIRMINNSNFKKKFLFFKKKKVLHVVRR